MKQTVDIFASIPPGELSLHAYFNLQDAYNAAKHKGTPMPPAWWDAYLGRLRLRLELLLDFAIKNNLPIYYPNLQLALSDVDPELLKQTFDWVLHEKNLIATEAEPPFKEGARTVVLMCGGPGSGKSSLVKEGEYQEGSIILTRDDLFMHLTPYPQLAKTHPNEATHIVVTEAILYNERDRYRYALLCGVPLILVDSTMSYRDLGLQMISSAHKLGYSVELLHMDADIDIATARAEARAKESGITINPKLLYESHVRCAANFFEYIRWADFSENWSNNGTPEQMYKFGAVYRMPLLEVQESTYRVGTRFFKYPQIVREGGTKQVGNQRIELIHLDEIVLVYMVRDVIAYNKLMEKAHMPLKDVSWPEHFDQVIAERVGHLSFLQQFA